MTRLAIIATATAGLLIVSLPRAATATVSTVWVGADPTTCDTTSLTTAISNASTAAGDTTRINVADDQGYDGLTLDLISRNITLTGGYAHCLDADPVELTSIAAPEAMGAILIESPAGSRQITLGNLDIHGGMNSDGGGLSIDGPVNVTLSNVRVHDNSATLGGGISLIGTSGGHPALSLVDDTRIGIDATHFNDAASGGGIYCVDAVLSIDRSEVLYNTASGYGGGVYLRNCALYSGGTYADDNSISHNKAYGGGGIAALNGSVIQMGSVGGHIEITYNSASGFGGGIDLEDADTHATLLATELGFNVANIAGGAAYVDLGAEFDLDRGDRDNVCTVSPCASLTGNTAPDGFAVYAAGGALVNLARSGVVGPGNEVANTGSVLHGEGANTHLGLYGVLMDRLPGAVGVQLQDGAMADISNLTLSGTALSYDFQAGTGTTLSISDSIIWDAPATAVLAGGTVISTDNDSHDTATLPGQDVDPGFVDATSHDFHLRGDSPNVDAYAVNPDTPATDIDGTPRPVDLYPDNGGVYDRGAYELGDEIFGNGFNGD